eukprot:UN00855
MHNHSRMIARVRHRLYNRSKNTNVTSVGSHGVQSRSIALYAIAQKSESKRFVIEERKLQLYFECADQLLQKPEYVNMIINDPSFLHLTRTVKG